MKKAGLEIKTTELIARGAALPDIGISPEMDKVAFALPQGGVSDPISTPQATAIVRVMEKANVSDAKVAAGSIRCATSWSTSAAIGSSAATWSRREAAGSGNQETLQRAVDRRLRAVR